ncbi:MAG: DHH family phosphoesterase [Patescibacteria group bacterium]
MELTPKQQALELINKSKNILLVTHERPDGDAMGSLMALYLVLGKLDKKVTAVVLDKLSSKYQFLPKVDALSHQLVALRDFIISIDCARATADRLAYNFQENKLNIVVTPKEGNFQSQDVSFGEGNFQFDLIITLDAADWDQVGKIYADNVKLFQGVPVVNIDHHSSNDYYGTVNLVDLTATATAEILVGLIEALGSTLMDEDVATALLAGIISDTGSFQNGQTTPKSLTIAAQMVGLGGRQQEIIKNLFKTKALTTLKLWGKILAGIKFDAARKLSWGVVPLAYFAETGAETEETSGVIDELMTSVPGADIVVLLSEKEPKSISGSIRTKKGVDAAELASLFGGGGHPGAAGFKLADMEVGAAEDLVITKIREYQEKKTTMSPDLVNNNSAGGAAVVAESKTEEEKEPKTEPEPSSLPPEIFPASPEVVGPELAPSAENLDKNE